MPASGGSEDDPPPQQNGQASRLPEAFYGLLAWDGKPLRPEEAAAGELATPEQTGQASNAPQLLGALERALLLPMTHLGNATS
ncbi:hypothetical protein C0993_010239, partial [Termitomyces sp. T159_Od127]